VADEIDLTEDPNPEFLTPAGFLIKVDREAGSCRVHREHQVEMVGQRRSPDQEIPFLLFIGSRFEVLLRTGDFTLVHAKGRRMYVPYRLAPEAETRNIILNCHSLSDQFPVYVEHFARAKEFFDQSKQSGFHYVFFDPDVSGYDRIVLKSKLHSAKMIILHPGGEEGEGVSEGVSGERSVERGDLSTNPVFQSRIFLRQLEIEKVKQMLVDYQMGNDEVQVIRTFIQVMLRNEEKKPEVDAMKKELMALDELYRLNAILKSKDSHAFESELDRGIEVGIASDLVPVVERMRRDAPQKEDEIRLWEWEYRLTKMTGKK